MQTSRSSFYDPEEIALAVEEKVNRVSEKGEPIDYLTFVPDGEPTLDVGLGRELELLRPLGIETAVITNASLLWREDVRRDLQGADYVSLKVDAVSKKTWRRVHRPHKSLNLDDVLDGVLKFADTFRGKLTTETMLVEGFNDDSEETETLARFLRKLEPDKAYLAIPIRPPATKTVTVPTEKSVNMAYQSLKERLDNVEYLIGYEGNAFASTGDVKEDLLSITAVHPMREEAVAELLSRAGTDWQVVRELIRNGSVVQLEYQGAKFYTRRFSTPKSQRAFAV